MNAAESRIQAFWCRIPSRPNFGDALTPWLIRHIAGQHPIFVRPENPRPKYLVVGSILAYATKACTVWGAGVMTERDFVSPEASLIAVRGPLSRARALACGVDCPETYGDPALLLPRFYRPADRARQSGGLIAHFSDMPSLAAVRRSPEGLRLIDVQDPIETIIDQIATSTFVASSSLHGIIVSHAYGVPALWVKFRDLPMGDDSKFRDYYLSIGQTPPEPVRLKYDTIDPDLLAGRATLPPLSLNLDRLWELLPFQEDVIKPAALFAGLRTGATHSGGIRCLQLMQLTEDCFTELCTEIVSLIHTEVASHVGDTKHVTNWTRPRGVVRQFSLLNASGRLDDFSIDHDLSCFGKRFHHAKAYPALGRFIGAFPHALNFRVNVLGPRARLSLHEEHVVIRTRAGFIGARLRFHLPIIAENKAELVLDGAVYHLAPGTIYLVNHGCVHSAANGNATDRIHLVWDMLLTPETFELMLGNSTPNLPAIRIVETEQIPAPLRTERMGTWLRLPPQVSEEEANGLGWCEVQ